MRRKILPTIDPLDGYIGKNYIPPTNEKRRLIRERGDEYVFTVRCNYDKLVEALRSYGYRSNFLSTLKYVQTSSGRSWEIGSMAYRDNPSSRFMHHAYWHVSDNDGWRFHIGHHKERNYLDLVDGLSEHTKTEVDGTRVRFPGDPDCVLKTALERRNLHYRQLEDPLYR